MTDVTYNEFVKREMNIWGAEYIEELIDKGYEPTLVIDSNGFEKWTWIIQPRITSRASQLITSR